MDFLKLHRAFPTNLRTDVQTVIAILPSSDVIHQNEQEVFLDGERLVIPTRIYFNEPDVDRENTLSDMQRVILGCIYLRHHDGRVRQKRLNTLIFKNQYFIVPYTFQLLGEYVLEIVNDLDRFIDETNIHLFRRFISENSGYAFLTKRRMVSYWNAYYRFGENVDLTDYIGSRVFERLEKP